jgi:hypothetical protein
MINLIGTVGNSFLFISSRMKVLLHNCVCVWLEWRVESYLEKVVRMVNPT